jgi:hypothetical protein
MVDPPKYQIKSRPLDMKVLDQGQGFIVESEGRIKLYIISNPTIILDREISSIQRSTIVVN